MWMEREHRKHERGRKSIRLLARSELKVCAVLVVGDPREGDLAPEIGGEEGVRFCDLLRDTESDHDARKRNTEATYRDEGGLQEVSTLR